MENHPQNKPAENDTQQKRQPAKENNAGGVKTKRKIRSDLVCGVIATILAVLAGVFVSLHRVFTVPAVLCLGGFFISGAVGFAINFKRNQGKHRIAYTGCSAIILLGLILCVYLLYWDRYRPVDIGDLTYAAVTNVGLTISNLQSGMETTLAPWRIDSRQSNFLHATSWKLYCSDVLIFHDPQGSGAAFATDFASCVTNLIPVKLLPFEARKHVERYMRLANEHGVSLFFNPQNEQNTVAIQRNLLSIGIHSVLVPDQSTDPQSLVMVVGKKP